MTSSLLLIGWIACSNPQPPPTPTTAPADTRPSVLLISLDTVRADRLEVYGGRAKTPHLNRFAAQGTRFESAIANFPETALSHWTMMTGVLPEVHGNVPATGDSRYTGPTLAERLRDVGYATAAFIGGETLTNASTGLSRGFGLYKDDHPWDRKDLKRPGAAVVADAAAWMKAQTSPSFTFVHLFDAHFPYTPPPPWDTAYDPDYAGTLTGSDTDLRPYRDGEKTPSAADLAHVLALYDGELSELDALIAPLLAEAGENTLVVITSDHGESFEHDYWFNHRDGLWDSVVRVPLLIRGPTVPKGKTIQQQVGLVDLMPSLLSLLKLPLPAPINGRSFTPLLAGKTQPTEAQYSITDPFRSPSQFAVRTEGHKVILRSELRLSYDLVTDPLEQDGNAKVPKELEKPRMNYVSGLKQVSTTMQGPEKPPRGMEPGEQTRLKALGYISD